MSSIGCLKYFDSLPCCVTLSEGMPLSEDKFPQERYLAVVPGRGHVEIWGENGKNKNEGNLG
jgi:hypothetical protein